MASHRRRASAGPDNGGGHFTFSASPSGRDSAPGAEYGAEYGAWAERIRGSRGYFGKSDDLKFGAWKRGALSLGGHEPVEGDFRWLSREEEEDDGSGTPSPPLWKDGVGSPAAEARSRYVDAEIYPTARAREIARYRQEMLEMVKDLPESGYELSLRDMVVQPATPTRTPPRTPKAEDEKGPAKGKGSPAKASGKDRKRMDKGMMQLSRSESMETGGFLLKMFTPVALGGGRRKSMSGGANSRAKVSPRPSFEAEKGCSEGTDGDWWKKNELSGSGGSSSSSSSNTSKTSSSSSNSNTSSGTSSSISTRSRKKMNGCYPFLLRNKK